MKSFKYTFLATLLVNSAVTPAHAGVSDVINEFFTFREEQKPLVAPNRELPPIEVITPYYDPEHAAAWSRYYTRQDVKPQKYIDDSSMVMRPDPRLSGYDAQPMDPQHPGMAYGQIPPQADMSQFPKEGVAQIPYGVHPHPTDGSGYGMVENRATMNQAQNTNGNIYLGEAGTAPNHAYGSGELGSGVQIDEPRYAWNEEGRTGYATPRAGDFDYNPKQRAEDVSKHMMDEQGYELSRSSGYVVEQSQDLRNRAGEARHQGNAEMLPAYTSPAPQAQPTHSIQAPSSSNHAGMAYNTQSRGTMPHSQNNLPNNYVVQPQDTLSGISGKDYIYGDWKLWPLIYDANRYQVKDPDLIHPGQNLGIPRDSNNTQQQDARTRALAKNPAINFYDGQ